MFLLVPCIVLALPFPELSAEFYGTATINWTNATIGSNVTAYDSEGVLCGYFIVTNEGYYGSLSCNADDPKTIIDEGAQLNDNLIFYIDGQRAVMFGNKTWQSGSFKELNLSAQNFAPTFNHSLNWQYINESSLFSYDVNCTDLNYWDNLSYYDNSSFFVINITNGIIYWTPTNNHVGNHSINITCSDGLLNTSGILNITVINIENPPVLDPIGHKIAIEGELFSLNISATDADNDTLTYSTNTTLFVINPTTGLISFTPTIAQVGNYTINISVTDGIFVDYEIISFRIVRGPYCGDGSCGITEDCSSCPSDCGICATSPLQEAGDTGQEDNEVIRNIISVCHERWECTEWSECEVMGYQRRKCIDVNKCGTHVKKPTEVEECIYEGTCFDRIQNCHHDLCEEGVDCGGPCEPCPQEPSCYDGIKNCHHGSCEEGVDTGGPCVSEEIKKYATIPVDMEKLGPIVRKYPWLFLLIISILISLTITGDQLYIKKITKKEFAEYRRKMKQYRKIKSKLYFFSLFVSVILFIISFYVYLLSGKRYLMFFAIWSTIGAAILILVSLPYLRSKFMYYNYQKRKKDNTLFESDRKEKENLINMEADILSKLELKTGKKIYDNIKRKKIPEELIDPLTDVYKLLSDEANKRKISLRKLTTEDKTRKLISELSSEEILHNLAKDYPQFNDILKVIRSLDKALSKKKINDRLIERIVSRFFISVSEVVIDSHLMSVVKSSESLIIVYNEIVEVYESYTSQLEEKHVVNEQLRKLEADFRKKIETISNNPTFIEKIRKNRLEFIYNNLVDLYNHYKKKEEINNDLKELEKKERSNNDH